METDENLGKPDTVLCGSDTLYGVLNGPFWLEGGRLRLNNGGALVLAVVFLSLSPLRSVSKNAVSSQRSSVRTRPRVGWRSSSCCSTVLQCLLLTNNDEQREVPDESEGAGRPCSVAGSNQETIVRIVEVRETWKAIESAVRGSV